MLPNFFWEGFHLTKAVQVLIDLGGFSDRAASSSSAAAMDLRWHPGCLLERGAWLVCCWTWRVWTVLSSEVERLEKNLCFIAHVFSVERHWPVSTSRQPEVPGQTSNREMKSCPAVKCGTQSYDCKQTCGTYRSLNRRTPVSYLAQMSQTVDDQLSTFGWRCIVSCFYGITLSVW